MAAAWGGQSAADYCRGRWDGQFSGPTGSAELGRSPQTASWFGSLPRRTAHLRLPGIFHAVRKNVKSALILLGM